MKHRIERLCVSLDSVDLMRWVRSMMPSIISECVLDHLKQRTLHSAQEGTKECVS